MQWHRVYQIHHAAKTAADNILNTLKKKNEVSYEVQQIMTDVAHISSKNEIAHQREHFKTLSNKLYSMVKNSGANQQTLYWQYCPMAFDNQGAYTGWAPTVKSETPTLATRWWNAVQRKRL